MDYEELKKETLDLKESLYADKKRTKVHAIAFGVLALMNAFIAISDGIQRDFGGCLSYSVIAILCVAIIAFCKRHISDIYLLELSMETMDRIIAEGVDLCNDIENELENRRKESEAEAVTEANKENQELND